MRIHKQENFTSAEDIQIQVPTCRLYMIIAVPQGKLAEAYIRARLVTSSGTKTVLERTSLKDLFEYGARNAGFYRIGYPVNGVEYYRGHIDVAEGGALDLTNSRYLSTDVTSKNSIGSLQLYAVTHPKLTDKYLYYNPVTINQNLQGVELGQAVDVIAPIDKIKLLKFNYPGSTGSQEYTAEELRGNADMSNDLVYVQDLDADGLTQKTVYGHDGLVVHPVTDAVSGLTATRLQVERADDAGQFNIILVEQKTLV